MRDLEVKIMVRAFCEFSNKLIYKLHYKTIHRVDPEDINLDLIGLSSISTVYNKNLKRNVRLERELIGYLEDMPDWG